MLRMLRWVGVLMAIVGADVVRQAPQARGEADIRLAPDLRAAEDESLTAWTSDDVHLFQPASVAANIADGLDADDDVLATQFLQSAPFGQRTPARRQPVGLAQPTSRQATRTVVTGLASVPYMIGDTGAGTCFSLRGIITADISHPSLTCSRLNISENNTALPVDRFYYSYRHFHNSNGIQVFQYRENFNFDRHTLGMERTFWDGMGSVEVRTPIEHRFRSDILSLVSPPDGVVDVVTGSADREVDLGNLAIVTKLLLVERRAFALSAGLGVTVPTARDVDYDIGVRDTIIFPIAPGVTGDTLSTFENTFENETVYLSPFMAWLWAPRSRWYHQGFLQIEVAANPSTFRSDGGGVTDFYFNGAPIGNVVFRTPGGLPTETDIFAQTLLRANLGIGYRLTDRDARRWISNIRALGEVHYTTTLQDGKLTPIAIEQIGVGAFFEQVAAAGNANSRADVLNVATGISADIGPLIVTNGVIAPLRSGTDRGFDFEYNLQVQLPY